LETLATVRQVAEVFKPRHPRFGGEKAYWFRPVAGLAEMVAQLIVQHWLHDAAKFV
jgi:hypothetical protein